MYDDFLGYGVEGENHTQSFNSLRTMLMEQSIITAREEFRKEYGRDITWDDLQKEEYLDILYKTIKINCRKYGISEYNFCLNN